MIIIPFLTFPSIEKLIIPKQSGESLNIKLRDNTIKRKKMRSIWHKDIFQNPIAIVFECL